MRAVLGIAAVELTRFVRDKGNIFFALILPLMLVFVIGSQFGSGSGHATATVTGADGELRSGIAQRLDDAGLDVSYAKHDDMLRQVARGESSVGVVIDEAAASAYAAGQPVEIVVIPSSSAEGTASLERARVAVAGLDLRQAQLAALKAAGVDEQAATAALDVAQEQASGPTLRVSDVNDIAQEFSGLGQYDLGASSQLLLFTFLSSLTGAATLINARREGVMARTLAAPISAAQVIGGQAIGRWVIAFCQGAYIMLASWLLFRVDWGNLALSLLILAMFAAVAAGAAMLLGSVLDNESAATGAGIGAGLVLAAIGGGMVPLEVFSDGMRRLAHITPHAWGYDAFAQVQRHGAGLVDILPMLGVLAAMAAVLLALGSRLLRRTMRSSR